MIEKVGLTEGAFTEVMTLLIELHAEGGYAPLDLDKAAKSVYQVIREDMTWLARDDSGEPIGVLGLEEVPFWYSGLTFLVSKWFYVRPEHRFGSVGVKLLMAARKAADERGQIAMVATSNPRRKPKRGTWMTVASEAAGYIPVGYMLRLGGARHVQRARDHTKHDRKKQAGGRAS